MNFIITTENEGPEGWEYMPLRDDNVFYDPKTTDEIALGDLVDLAANGDIEPLLAAERRCKGAPVETKKRTSLPSRPAKVKAAN